MIGILREFKEFITKGNAFDLAIGVIIGGAFGPVVNSMVKDIIMPVVSLAVGKASFEHLYLPLSPGAVQAVASALEAGQPMPTLQAMVEAGHAVMPYGNFINALVSFFFLMLGVFILIKVVNTLRRPAPAAAPAAPPAPPRQEVLLEEIRDLLKK
jgi:large conductance mechanosensitive channel